MKQTQLKIQTNGIGLYEITDSILKSFQELPETGLLNIFVQHTSCSLLIQENADPTAKQDLEEFLDRLVPMNQSWHRHTLEGPDDTVSHLKSAITATSLNIPIVSHQLGLGTWQGIYLWEHRESSKTRTLIATISS